MQSQYTAAHCENNVAALRTYRLKQVSDTGVEARVTRTRITELIQGVSGDTGGAASGSPQKRQNEAFWNKSRILQRQSDTDVIVESLQANASFPVGRMTNNSG